MGTASCIDEMKLFRLMSILLACGFLVSLVGCASTKKSDVPWNVPQPWEGTPNIPGSP